jgi:enamine deaminase RidA (YjgF/YER057c/UK114 family)
MVEYFNPPTLCDMSAIYSHAVKAGNLIFAAGQCAHRPLTDGRRFTASEPADIIVGKGDPYVQARLCYENVRHALEGAGASMRDVVKINTYSTHPDYRAILIATRGEFFEPPYPASTGVVVTSLFDPAALFEVEVIAYVDK